MKGKEEKHVKKNLLIIPQAILLNASVIDPVLYHLKKLYF